MNHKYRLMILKDRLDRIQSATWKIIDSYPSRIFRLRPSDNTGILCEIYETNSKYPNCDSKYTKIVSHTSLKILQIIAELELTRRNISITNPFFKIQINVI